MGEDDRDFVDLMDEMGEHEYEGVSNKLSDIRIVLHTLERNFELLSNFVDEYVLNEEYVLDAPLSHRMRVKEELYRLLHNYLSAYESQYEYTKSLRDRRFSEEGKDEYNRLLREHDIRPTSDFLKTMRNLIQKHVLVNANTVYSWKAEDADERVSFLVYREDIEEWKSTGNYWSPKTGEFLEGYGDDRIPLLSVIEEHHTDLMAFHDDFRGLVIDEHEEELDEYLELQERMVEDAKKTLGTDESS
ncbi:hypothetical protein [Haloarcula marina]|uniref:hypothetical protein n=1 Tax=Haloarcula marina TaxID=2961574 RepID=UPI0020B6A46F|nr:hypothetical protein [Halomicroarcula marina]